eukprot:TRINITY_DN12652_c0_g1_i1.p1 TRINITY_DN12652_c0_g1~~TRINITY_DN12652_c0_g1_i1.p1  ORF type:complete len:260 (-),score=63.13 TRINITY_DN12652_c0_g1_i1:290-1069(-)
MDDADNHPEEKDWEDPVGKDFWTKNFPDQPDAVPWKQFYPALYAFLQQEVPKEELPVSAPDTYLSPEEIDILSLFCIRNLLCKLVEGVKTVEYKRWIQFLGWFGPIVIPCPKEKGIIHKVFEIFTDRPKTDSNQFLCWFHGDTSRKEAEDRMLQCSAGSFLIRFSSSRPHSFAITVAQVQRKGETKVLGLVHREILHRPGSSTFTLVDGQRRSYSSLQELVRKESNRELLGLRLPVESPFRFLFSQRFVSFVDGYVVDK